MPTDPKPLLHTVILEELERLIQGLPHLESSGSHIVRETMAVVSGYVYVLETATIPSDALDAILLLARKTAQRALEYIPQSIQTKQKEEDPTAPVRVEIMTSLVCAIGKLIGLHIVLSRRDEEEPIEATTSPEPIH